MGLARSGMDGTKGAGGGMEGLVADQHGDAVPRYGDQCFERRNSGPRSGGVGSCALHVERSGETRTVARRQEPQGLVLGRGYRAHGFELA